MKKLFVAAVITWLVPVLCVAQKPVPSIPRALNGWNPENPWRWGYTPEQIKDYVLSSPGWRTIDSVDAPINWLGYESLDRRCVMLFKFNSNEFLNFRVIVYILKSKEALNMDDLLSSLPQPELNTWIDERSKSIIKRRYDGANVQYILTYQD